MWTKTVVFLLLLIAVLLEVESSKKCPRIKKKLIKRINNYDNKCSALNQGKLLRFPEKISTANYVILKPDMSLMREELSVCTWLKKRLDMDRKGIPWFSYAVSGAENSLLLKAADHNVLIGSGKYFDMRFSTTIMRDEWYNLCFTWKSGRADYYMNGVWVYTGNVHPTGKLALGGTLVLGQEQDSPGGHFDINDLFAGDMYQLNMFKRKLTLEEVTEMFYNGRCADLSPALAEDLTLSWEDILTDGEKKGDVTEEENECKFQGLF